MEAFLVMQNSGTFMHQMVENDFDISELNRFAVFVFDSGSTQAGRGILHAEALGVEASAFGRAARCGKLCRPFSVSPFKKHLSPRR